MSLRAFLCAVDMVRVEEGIRFHVETVTPEPTPLDNRQRNADSMQALMGIMSGVKR